MTSTGGKEAEAITALCSAHAVILDAETFAALAARDLLEVAHEAFGADFGTFHLRQPCCGPIRSATSMTDLCR